MLLVCFHGKGGDSITNKKDLIIAISILAIFCLIATLFLITLTRSQANYSVSEMSLAPYAIPFNMSFAGADVFSYTTDYAGFDDMPNASVTLTINRTSELLIMLNTCAWITVATNDPTDTYLKCRALVDGTLATPGSQQLTPTMTLELGHAHLANGGPCSCDFYFGPLAAGTHTIKIQWCLSEPGRGAISNRILEVIALPA